MSKAALYELLHQERELVIDPATGHVVKREAWERIDNLLDCLSALNHLGSEAVLLEVPQAIPAESVVKE